MSNKSKNILLGLLVVGIISMTVVFAAFSTRLNIQGTTNVAATKWNVHFQQWALDTENTVDGHTNTAVYPDIQTLTSSMSDSTNVTKVENLNVTLKQPGDYAKYTFEIKNDGTIDAKLSNFAASLTPSSNVIGYEVKCYENSTREGTEITQNSVLGVNEIAYCYIKVEYKDQTNNSTAGENQVYTQGAVSTSLEASWTWIQDDGVVAASWDNYITPTQTSGGSTLPSGTNFWIQQNTSSGSKEVCGILSGTTVCLTNASSRAEEFTDAANGNVTGYASQKKTEMESINGVSCSVRSSYMRCDGGTVRCRVYNNGDVSCGDGGRNCGIYDDGNAVCE